MFRWVLAGLIGAAIGALVWVLIGYFTGYEVGYIAWGVGFLAGLGVRIAAGESHEGAMPGVIAAVIAVFGVLAAKYLVTMLLVNQAFAELDAAKITDMDDMVARESDNYAEELENEGQEVQWPEVDEDNEDLPIKDTYPVEVWAEGKKRWDALTPEQQKEKIAAYEAEIDLFMQQFEGQIREEAFRSSFSAWDLLWIGLAVVTAFKVGAATYGDEE